MEARHPGRHFLATPQVLLADKRRVLRGSREPLQPQRGDVHPICCQEAFDLSTIVPAYEALVERAQGIQRAQVVSAVPLTDAETTRLHASLERSTGKKIRLSSLIEPALIGGALVRIGDRVIDRTVQNLLLRIGEEP